MSSIRIKSIKIANYRPFKEQQDFCFPDISYKKPVAIVGYNNSGKTNLMNAILYGIGYNYISENTFSKSDLHNIDHSNQISIETELTGSIYGTVEKYGKTYDQTIEGTYHIISKIDDGELKSECLPSFFGKNKYYQVFYINFHNIKDEILTSKTSRGNLRSFLAKHIKKLVDEDPIMKARQETFSTAIKTASSIVLDGSEEDAIPEEQRQSKLSSFIDKIKQNYNKNLRDNNIVIEFGLPDYEDIFLQMMFKIGLNGNTENLVPISHFGDGYISMFVMAVIQAIAEENIEDKCLFLFEEPESFLHENHQEYFYKMVLCGLSEKGHQVIYTTHSDKMIDIFDTKGLIRLDIEGDRTVKKYNNINDEVNLLEEEIVDLKKYNDYVRTIEPNLNRILFSKKVILVEGPNDIMVYKHCIEKKVEEKSVSITDPENRKKFAETYLNFHNIAIVPHHGKSTAIYLIKLCKHFGLEYFAINDRDFQSTDLAIGTLSVFSDISAMQADTVYTSSEKKGMITTNFNLIKEGGETIHFSIPKLEVVIGYTSDDKNSYKIHQHINNATFTISDELFPNSLIEFLGINTLS